MKKRIKKSFFDNLYRVYCRSCTHISHKIGEFCEKCGSVYLTITINAPTKNKRNTFYSYSEYKEEAAA